MNKYCSFFPLGIVGKSNFTSFFFIIILIHTRIFGWPRRERAKELNNAQSLRTVHRKGLNKNEVTGEKAHVGFPDKAISEDLWLT